MNTNEQKMVELIREEYSSRLLELFRENVRDIFETDMFDKQGNQLLSQGLKVRHKASGYEYTVDHVEGDGENATVFLRHPETPRFKPSPSETQLTEADDDENRISVDQVDLAKVSDDKTLDMQVSAASTQDPMDSMKQMSKGSLLKVGKKEFEKEYEVK